MSSRYTDWLRYVFDRPDTPEAWYVDPDLDLVPFEAAPLELASLVASTFEHCGRDLASCSDEQLSHGLRYLLTNDASDTVFALMSEEVPMALRLRAIGAIKRLYSDLFEQRCAPVLLHTGESGGSALNVICYMLWDASPLSYWERARDKEVFYDAVAEVLEHALHSSNPACVESALHGLGHLHLYCPGRVEELVDAFLQRDAGRFPALRSYAQAARTGSVL